VIRASKKPPGGRLNEHVGGPRALRNDDDGEFGAHHAPFNRLGHPASNIHPSAGGDRIGRTVENRGDNTPRPCESRVDESGISGDWRKVSGITLGIRKYRLTRCFSSARVSFVPGSARQPGHGNRAARADLRIGSSGDGPGSRGAANPERGEKPQLRPIHSTGNRRVGGAECRADVERTPQLSVRQRFGRRYCDGTVYRVSVNGVDGADGAGFARPPRIQLRHRGPRQRAPRSGSPATEAGSPANRVGEAP